MGKFTQIWLVAGIILMISLGGADHAQAEEALVEDEGGNFVHRSSLAIRVTPLGLSFFSDTGYHQPLWDDDDSDILTNTKIEAGVATALSPAFGWAGPYVEFLPVAVLNLRVSAQFMGYFGNFGYLYRPGGDGELDWSPDALNASEEAGLGESATGWMVQAQARPQMRVGRVVATAETNFHWIRMNLDSEYYEPYFDLLFAPQEFMWVTRPTVGYLFGADLSEGYLLVGARWERAVTSQTELVRDTVGLVFNWKVHSSIMEWGDPALAGFGGVFIDHPNRGRISPYFGMQAMVNF